MNKKDIIKYTILLIIFIGSIIFMNNSAFLYKETIVKVINVEETLIDTETEIRGITENQYLQEVKVEVLNGSYKGDILIFENETNESNVYGENYSENTQIFVTLSSDGTSIEKVNDIRRDIYLMPIIVLFVCLLLLVGNKKGLYSFIGLLINIFIVFIALLLRFEGLNIFYLFIIASILFTTISLILSSGINKKTLIAIISTLSTLFISFIISFIVLKIFENQIPYWYMDYVEVLFDYERVFFISILVGGLGAIMDMAITISSTLNELKVNNKNITTKELKKSGMEVSKDVMGTMANVLLFSYISGSIPMLLFVMRNEIPLALAINSYAKLEIIRFLTSSIGLVLAILISLFFALKLIKGRE